MKNDHKAQKNASDGNKYDKTVTIDIFNYNIKVSNKLYSLHSNIFYNILFYICTTINMCIQYSIIY